jgi:Na+-driven multidrug efflux pump
VGVGTRLDTFVLFAAAGWGAAATATVAQCIGAADPVRAHELGRIAAICSGLLAGVVVLVFAVFADPILRLFVDYPRESTDPSYQGYLRAGREYLRIAVLAHPFSAFCLALTGALNGTKVTLPPLLFDSVVFLLILLPVASYIENYNPAAGLSAIWWTVVGANLLLAILYAVFFEGLHRSRSCATVPNCRS